jgi:hypothetical protein
MAFALAVNNLLEAMKKSGCPVCRISRQAAERALESFLWENVNEPDVRQGILDSLGFCPLHTRVMVARELVTSSLPLGTNIIYEHLGREIAGTLKKLRPGSAASVVNGLGSHARRLLEKAGLLKHGGGPLHPRGECPACTAGNNSAWNALHVLCEELQKEGEVRSSYLACDGLCLPHLRDAIEHYAGVFPSAIQLLIDDTVQRLEAQSVDMKEYIRKANWAYRDEKLTEAEDTAWRKTLTFFTGLGGEKYIYKVEE